MYFYSMFNQNYARLLPGSCWGFLYFQYILGKQQIHIQASTWQPRETWQLENEQEEFNNMLEPERSNLIA